MRQARISVVVQTWSGWSREQPKPARFEFRAQPGQVISAQSVGHPDAQYAIAIGGINALGVQLTYSGVVVRNADGTINLSAPQTGSLVLAVGKSLRLVTATMDAGTNIDVTLDSVE